MIQGIGIDIVEIERFDRSIARFGDRLLTKLFTDGEIRNCTLQEHPAKHFAACFAVKEALSKALETGNSGIFTWRSAELVFPPDESPSLRLYNTLAGHLKPHNIHLSLSFTETHVIACVIIQNHRSPE